MTDNLKDKFPLTHKVLLKLCDNCKDCTQQHKWFWWKDVVIKTKEKVYKDKVVTYLSQIQEPIWSVCESILNGDYEAEFESEDKGTVEVGGVVFKLHMIYHMGVDLGIKPRIWDTREERELLTKCFHSLMNYELHGKYREELLENYKE